MKLTCAQMDVLLSFYLDGELSESLKSQVNEHLSKCPTCQAKYDIIKSMFSEIKESIDIKEETLVQSNDRTTVHPSQQYSLFRNNLSAYLDNELSNEDNIKIKKFTINNKSARKELESSYNIRKLIQNSFLKTKNDAKQDYSKKVMKQLKPYDETMLEFNPLIKLFTAFTISVLILTTIVVMALSMQ